MPAGSKTDPPLAKAEPINNGSGIECTLSKFADNIKLCGVVNTLEGRDAIQRDLERWACENLMKFKKAKYKILHMGQYNPTPTPPG
ncbi:cAMP-dependent protein kinase inhibitor alpha [Grus japonensis]|uniref:cAMP-dependent protein kinase inhibitor alpha n=1 Tax=Grus japonensis TaxID=30415 RepID=A0ABC9Y4N6_GRUJA